MSKSAVDLALEQAERRVTAREGDETSEIPAIEAVYRTLYITATKHGSAYAQKHIIERHDHAQRIRQKEIEESNEFWTAYIDRCRSEIKVAKASKLPEPDFKIHPDDIVIEAGQRVRFIGPFDDASKAKVRETIAFREALLLQAALDERLMPEPEDGNRCKGPGTAFEFARVMNRSLPPRLRLTDLAMYYRMNYYAGHSIRWLLKTVYNAWRKLGKSRKRGELFPPLGQGLTKLSLLHALGERILDGSLDEDSEEQAEEIQRENRRIALHNGWIDRSDA